MDVSRGRRTRRNGYEIRIVHSCDRNHRFRFPGNPALGNIAFPLRILGEDGNPVPGSPRTASAQMTGFSRQAAGAAQAGAGNSGMSGNAGNNGGSAAAGNTSPAQNDAAADASSAGDDASRPSAEKEATPAPTDLLNAVRNAKDGTNVVGADNGLGGYAPAAEGAAVKKDKSKVKYNSPNVG